MECRQTVTAMSGLSLSDLAKRGGVDDQYVEHLVELRLIVPDEHGRFSMGDARRIGMLIALSSAGLALEGIVEIIRQGRMSLEFADTPTYERFSALGAETFLQVAARTGVPVELLTMLREAMGTGSAAPRDLMREDELAIVPFLEIQISLGFSNNGIERLLRTYGDSMRRIAQAEADWFRTEAVEPSLAAGRTPREIAALGTQESLAKANERALLAMLHAQEMQTWMGNIIAGFEQVMAQAGLHTASTRDPAICFLDMTGYTRLTQERGDTAAAALAERLNRLVKRTSMQHGGQPVKWLGDGVMFHFPDPAQAVLAALEMVNAILAADLPPAHVGLHAGPVVLQDGDYYGQTVNIAARIADYARPGEVLVSGAVVEAARPPGVAFEDIGNVELKGVTGVVHLAAARRGGASA